MRRTLPLIAAGPAACLALVTEVAASPAATSVAASVLPAATTPVEGTEGVCTPEQGVTVAVQFEENTVVRCAEGDPTSGEEALTSAGFELEHDKAGMVCSISYQDNPYPEEGQDGWTCGDYEGEFWSYWTAEADAAEWTSSQVGAGEHDPAVGEAAGWRYADGTPQPNDGEVPAAEGGEAGEPSEDGSDDAGSGGDIAGSDGATSEWPGWATWALMGGTLVAVAVAGVGAALARRR